MRLRVLPGRFAVCRLAASDAAARVVLARRRAVRRGGAARGDELSLVCRVGRAAGRRASPSATGSALEIEGPMEFTLTGVLASVAAPLAEAGVPIFALATYDTDVVLVPGARAERRGRARCAARRATRSTAAMSLEPLVLLHGIGSHRQMWEPVLAAARGRARGRARSTCRASASAPPLPDGRGADARGAGRRGRGA